MLYISTRNNTDSFTAHRTLCDDTTPDGGLFVPFKWPVITNDGLSDIMNRSFGENVAYILNLFFSIGLTGWDIDFCLGRKPIKTVPTSHRLVIAEIWHNHNSDFAFVENSLYTKLCGSKCTRSKPTRWAQIAIRIAVIFGIWAELSHDTIWEGDAVATVDDFSAFVYAKKMGLPIKHIICATTENSQLWDLVHHGFCATGGLKYQSNKTPDWTAECIERLIFDVFGLNENKRFLQCCQKRTSYQMDENAFDSLTEGLFVSVASGNRIESVCRRLFQSSRYISDLDTALCYGGLQDYRASTGSVQPTILCSKISPGLCVNQLGDILKLSPTQIAEIVNYQ